MSLVCVAQPLEGADGHGSVEGTRPEWHPISHVTQHQVTLDLSLLSNACEKRILSCHCHEIVGFEHTEFLAKLEQIFSG